MRHTLKKRVVDLNSTTEEHLCVIFNKMTVRTENLDSKREYA